LALHWLNQPKIQWRQLGRIPLLSQLPQQGQILRLVLSWWTQLQF
jgi:hypothetical protein